MREAHRARPAYRQHVGVREFISMELYPRCKFFAVISGLQNIGENNAVVGFFSLIILYFCTYFMLVCKWKAK